MLALSTNISSRAHARLLENISPLLLAHFHQDCVLLGVTAHRHSVLWVCCDCLFFKY